MDDPIILKALIVASGGMFSFGSILLVLVLLGAEGGLAKALAYVGGNSGGYLLIGLGSFALRDLVVQGDAGGAQSGSGVGLWVRLGFGLLLITLGLRTWLKVPDPEAAKKRPTILTKVDGMRLRGLVGLGAMISLVNFKNIAIFFSALAQLEQAALAFAPRLLVLAAIIAVFCSSLIVPIVIFALFRRRATPWLQAVRRRIEGNARQLSIIVMFVFGSIFAGGAILELLGLL